MRVEAAAGQQSQQIEQLRALAANVPRQATTKPADDPPREVATPRSIRPATESLEEKLNLQQSKLLNDVYKLADVSAKFSAPQTDFADFLAQKAAE
ncbi:MAG: hypothetical protein HYV60_22660, partial [Planctomycetia bacterium]|nr:hypothetical protein [Planctomycetia bacterium]